MTVIKKVYLSGLGAIGSAYASRLYELNPDYLRVVADKERIERYLKSGYTVNDNAYAFNFIQPEEKAVPADLIIIAVKQHHLEQSIKDIKNFVGQNTIILSLLNGIISEEIIGKEYGIDKLLYSFCVGTDAVRIDTNTKFSNIGKIVFGEKTNIKYSSKVEAVKELFDRAQIPYSIPEDMIREQWWKFMMNVGINQASAVLKAPYGVFQRINKAQELMEMASREVIQLAKKISINLDEEDITGYKRILNTLSPDGKTSMLQDVEALRKTEVDIFSGTVIELGRKYGVETPVNDMLYRIIRAMEEMYLNLIKFD